MNEKIRGSIKSKTIITNGAGIVAMLAFWNDPRLQGVPDEAKYIALVALAVNVMLRYLTSQPIDEKGKSNNQKLVDDVSFQVMEGMRPMADNYNRVLSAIENLSEEYKELREMTERIERAEDLPMKEVI